MRAGWGDSLSSSSVFLWLDFRLTRRRISPLFSHLTCGKITPPRLRPAMPRIILTVKDGKYVPAK
jgi:hypothetical protein